MNFCPFSMFISSMERSLMAICSRSSSCCRRRLSIWSWHSASFCAALRVWRRYMGMRPSPEAATVLSSCERTSSSWSSSMRRNCCSSMTSCLERCGLERSCSSSLRRERRTLSARGSSCCARSMEWPTSRSSCSRIASGDPDAPLVTCSSRSRSRTFSSRASAASSSVRCSSRRPTCFWSSSCASRNALVASSISGKPRLPSLPRRRPSMRSTSSRRSSSSCLMSERSSLGRMSVLRSWSSALCTFLNSCLSSSLTCMSRAKPSSWKHASSTSRGARYRAR
mmetsp:Transcript_21207/g.64595  ORF Transcript_21207/g.64595 Transcript_21207/m.64595 type:complete len:281 (-) Transcript_21207:648-1490(-)